ncbi:MAG: hypothetical protein ACKOWR_02175 [Micrococcales bacterium]
MARVAIDSPLPNLDRLFDYLVPETMHSSVVVGARVKAPFGRSKKALDAFVVELSDSSDFSGKLAELSEVVSTVPVLNHSLYVFLRSVAERQACTLGDLLKLAVPNRSVAVEKKFLAEQSGYSTVKKRKESSLTTAVIEPRDNTWARRMVEFAKSQASAGFSSILLVPDFRDQNVLRAELSATGVDFIDYSTDRKPSQRYESFLQCLRPGAHVVVGSRNSIYAPLSNLGGIFLFDDGDDNLVEPTSPYVHARDVALLRQASSGCDLAIESHYRSPEVQRLVELGFLKDSADKFRAPDVAVSEELAKLPTMAWQAVRQTAIDEEQAVLIQVASKGVARSTYCYDCGARAQCHHCHGPIWIDGTNTPRCRWCSAINLNFQCGECMGSRLKQGAGGATRTAAEIGKSFPGVQIIESTGDKPLLEIKPGKRIVISTPGAEPRVAGGYGCVVILDAAHALAKDSLRAKDIALRNWTNAIALLSDKGRAVVSGVPQQLGQMIALWQHREIASQELTERRELDFPPALRLASIQGEKTVAAAVIQELDQIKYQILGPINLKSDKTDIDQRYVIKYQYAQGPELATSLKSAIAKLSSGTVRIGANGRSSRAIRVRMDDPEVI